jgi:hypothetical protein
MFKQYNTILITGLLASTIFAVSTTGWPMKTINWDLNRAYPGILYEWRLAVKGGVYPYSFTLISGPDGLSVDTRKGVLKWTPPNIVSKGNIVQIRITDSKGTAIDHNYTIDITKDGFFFVAPDGMDTNDGTLEKPWATISKAQSSAGKNGFIYVKSGNYSISNWDINSNSPGKWFAYPGEKPILDLGLHDANVERDTVAIVGFEIKNASLHMFWGSGKFLIWRKNVMHGLNAGSSMENPAFIFFPDVGAKPIENKIAHDKIVIQDNTFYDLQSSTGHGASVTCYDVSNLLFEDNEAYQISSRGVSDKDDGYYNTFRNNVLHDCNDGIGLYSQYTQGKIEVCYNLIYNCPSGVVVGSQPGFIRDIYIHHNTIVGGSIAFGVVTSDITQSYNFNIYNNIITNASSLIYALPAIGGNGSYTDAAWVTNPSGAKVSIDSNIIWTTGQNVAGMEWGIPLRTFTNWKSIGFDTHSQLVNPNLSSAYTLPSGSPSLGIYGRDMAGVSILHDNSYHSKNYQKTFILQNKPALIYNMQGRRLNHSMIKNRAVFLSVQQDDNNRVIQRIIIQR